MQIFAKPVWDLTPSIWRGVGFNTKSACDTFLGKIQGKDAWMLLIATLQPMVPWRKRGKVLGLAKFDPRVVETKTFVDEGGARQCDIGENDELRWEFGFRYTSCYVFHQASMRPANELFPYSLTQRAKVESGAHLIEEVEVISTIQELPYLYPHDFVTFDAPRRCLV